MVKKSVADRLKQNLANQGTVDKERFDNTKRLHEKEEVITSGNNDLEGSLVPFERTVWEGKVVRLGISIMPEEDKMVMAMKRKLMMEGIEVSASDILRAGLRALYKRDLQSLNSSIAKLPKPKSGRPKTKS